MSMLIIVDLIRTGRGRSWRARAFWEWDGTLGGEHLEIFAVAIVAVGILMLSAFFPKSLYNVWYVSCYSLYNLGGFGNSAFSQSPDAVVQASRPKKESSPQHLSWQSLLNTDGGKMLRFGQSIVRQGPKGSRCPEVLCRSRFKLPRLGSLVVPSTARRVGGQPGTVFSVKDE